MAPSALGRRHRLLASPPRADHGASRRSAAAAPSRVGSRASRDGSRHAQAATPRALTAAGSDVEQNTGRAGTNRAAISLATARRQRRGSGPSHAGMAGSRSPLHVSLDSDLVRVVCAAAVLLVPRVDSRAARAGSSMRRPRPSARRRQPAATLNRTWATRALRGRAGGRTAGYGTPAAAGNRPAPCAHRGLPCRRWFADSASPLRVPRPGASGEDRTSARALQRSRFAYPGTARESGPHPRRRCRGRRSSLCEIKTEGNTRKHTMICIGFEREEGGAKRVQVKGEGVDCDQEKVWKGGRRVVMSGCECMYGGRAAGRGYERDWRSEWS